MMALASIVALAYVVGQGFLLWSMLRFVRSFGAFVESHDRSSKALLLTHESNLIVHQQNLKVLTELQRIHSLPKAGVA
jgi:hypothetical protein